jgi:hypothetical protein
VNARGNRQLNDPLKRTTDCSVPTSEQKDKADGGLKEGRQRIEGEIDADRPKIGGSRD